MCPSFGTSCCSPLPSRGFQLALVPHVHRYYGLIRLLHVRPAGLWSPLTGQYLGMTEETGGLPGSWGIPVRACPGLETPAARRDLAYRSSRYSLPLNQTRRHPQPVAISELNPRGPLPRCLRFTSPVAQRRCKTRYRPARYGVDRSGFSPAGFHREVSCAHLQFPSPRLSLAR
jgi:hypothetical protein